MAGYAVLDLETTGIFPGAHDRVLEVGVVTLDSTGEVVQKYATLVNPGRDLGPASVHGLLSADIRRAPDFGAVAGDLLALLTKRVLVGHNLRFDIGFLAAEFQRLGVAFPASPDDGVCTMAWADRLLGAGGRSLSSCCAAAGVPHNDAHSALGDAVATASLFRALLMSTRQPPPWADQLRRADVLEWPYVEARNEPPVQRGAAAVARPQHFLARIATSAARAGDASIDAYLAVLDDVLIDGLVSDTEADSLVALASELGLDRDQVVAAHSEYLVALARAAWADGIITTTERAQLQDVAALLDLPSSAVDVALDAAEPESRIPIQRPEPEGPALGQFRLAAADQVVLTGEMCRPRDEWVAIAEAAGLVVHGGVTKKTRLLVAADPDSLSGKARKARSYGVPVVTEEAFARLVEALQSTQHG